MHAGRLWWHWLALLALSAGFESLFVHHGLGWFDEAWPLHAAKRLHEGGALYRDVFFLFPPGHLLPAWIATALGSPGVVLARAIYAGFTVALVLASYALGRRLMPALFALLGAALIAVSAPESHLVHLLFGYRYLVFSVLALLAFSRHLETGDRRWLMAAGAAAGVGLVFRLSPSFAVSCGIGLALLAARPDPRDWFRDGLVYAGSLLAVTLPVLVWMALGPGLDTVWTELVVRLAGLQSAQALAAPVLAWPDAWSRDAVTGLFVALQIRAYPLLLLVVLGFLVVAWIRARRRGEGHPQALLLAVVVWAAVYLVRVIGRSDDHHLYSALPPLCVLIAFTAWRGMAALARRRDAEVSAFAGAAVAAGIFALWVFLMGSDTYLDPARRGTFPLRSVAEDIRVDSQRRVRSIDRRVRAIRRWSGPEDSIFTMSLTPIFYALADRRGPGRFDILMPGTFLGPDEEIAFLEELRREPPAIIVFPVDAFDEMDKRSVWATAPRVSQWVRESYLPIEPVKNKGFVLMAPRAAVEKAP